MIYIHGGQLTSSFLEGKKHKKKRKKRKQHEAEMEKE
jgi:hypothetical protein